MTLSLDEFLRRFCLHILPVRFVKIRLYGLLANRGRDGRIERARQFIGAPPAETSPAQAETPVNDERFTPRHPAETSPAQAETPTEAANVKPQLTCVHCGWVRVRLLAVIQPMRFTPKSPTAADTS